MMHLYVVETQDPAATEYRIVLYPDDLVKAQNLPAMTFNRIQNHLEHHESAFEALAALLELASHIENKPVVVSTLEVP